VPGHGLYIGPGPVWTCILKRTGEDEAAAPREQQPANHLSLEPATASSTSARPLAHAHARNRQLQQPASPARPAIVGGGPCRGGSRGKGRMGNVTSSVAARLAFFPPEPATYGVEPAAENGALLRMTGVLPDAGVEVRALPTRAGTRVVSAFWRHPAARLTLLYSHGNAADLGQMLGLFLELRAHLRVNIMRSVSSHTPLSPPLHYFCCSTFGSSSLFVRHPITNTRIIPILFCLQQLRQLLTDLRRSDFVRVIEQSVQF
jgi:hypothetical protein